MSVPRSSISYCDFSGGDANFVMRGRRPGECETSEGCVNCYALRMLQRFGSGPEVTTFYEEKLARLLRVRFQELPGRPWRRPGGRPLVFACDMGDWLHPNISPDLAREIVAHLGRRADVDWLLLTKRAERLLEIGEFPPNVWPGVTVESQVWLWRVPALLAVPATLHWVSVEPILGPVKLSEWLDPIMTDQLDLGNPYYARLDWPMTKGIQWVVCGAESGPNRRQFDYDWARSLRDQCRGARVAFHFKQGSALRPGHGCFLDGQVHREFPDGIP